eukprot:TRINITY_DN61610_c0_g1_i1.p1 TRINITY_DN61610_c0_g1~~TRINITY_DN61610_c0_g1_i1.p1  ORF type:complete len:687 (+),score=164.65 TRINITY_DN61610_c0_g1_i1:72-2063(+)
MPPSLISSTRLTLLFAWACVVLLVCGGLWVRRNSNAHRTARRKAGEWQQSVRRRRMQALAARAAPPAGSPAQRSAPPPLPPPLELRRPRAAVVAGRQAAAQPPAAPPAQPLTPPRALPLTEQLARPQVPPPQRRPAVAAPGRLVRLPPSPLRTHAALPPGMNLNLRRGLDIGPGGRYPSVATVARPYLTPKPPPGPPPAGVGWRCDKAECVADPSGPYKVAGCLGVCGELEQLGPDWSPPPLQPAPSTPTVAFCFTGHFRGLGAPLVHRSIRRNLVDAFGGRSSVFFVLKFEEVAWPMNTRDQQLESIASRPGVIHHDQWLRTGKVRIPSAAMAKAIKWLEPLEVHQLPDDSEPLPGCSLHRSRLLKQALGIHQALLRLDTYETRNKVKFDYWVRTRPDQMWVRRFPHYSVFSQDAAADLGPAYIVHDIFELLRGSRARTHLLSRLDRSARQFDRCPWVFHEQVTSSHYCRDCVPTYVAGCSYLLKTRGPWSGLVHTLCHNVETRCQGLKGKYLFQPWNCLYPFVTVRELRPVSGQGEAQLTTEGFWGCYGVPVCNLNYTAPADVDRQVELWHKLEMCGRCAKVWGDWRRSQQAVPCFDHTAAEGSHIRYPPFEQCERELAAGWEGPRGCTYDHCAASRWHMIKPKHEWPRTADGRYWNDPQR